MPFGLTATIEDKALPPKVFHNLPKQLLLQFVLEQQVAKPPQRIPVGNLVARIHFAGLRERAAVHHLRHRRHVRRVI